MKIIPTVVSIAAFSLSALCAERTTRESVNSNGGQAQQGKSERPAISDDGRYVAFASEASNLVSGDSNSRMDVFVHDRLSRATRRVSTSSTGEEGNDHSGRFVVSLSADGRFVAFDSFASNLVSEDTNGDVDVFVHELATGVTTRASVSSSGEEGNGWSYYPSLSADGRYVGFESSASNLVPGDGNGQWDVFVHDRESGTTVRVSVDSSGQEGNSGSGSVALSASGLLVTFSSYASNLVSEDHNDSSDVFVRDLIAGTTVRVSVSSSGGEGSASSSQGNISGDGRYVAFTSRANLAPEDNLDTYPPDIYVHDRQTQVTSLVSISSSGTKGSGRNSSISRDGRYITFISDSIDLVPGDDNDARDVFVHDQNTAKTFLMSVDSVGAQGNADSNGPVISAFGRYVAFDSHATNLVGGDDNDEADVFVRDWCPAGWANYGVGWPGTAGIPNFVSLEDPVLCTTITLQLDNSLGLGTLAALFAGWLDTILPTAWGGDLWLVPKSVAITSMPAGGLSFPANLPCDEVLCGLAANLQVLELDPGASHGVSFTRGLKLFLGK